MEVNNSMMDQLLVNAMPQPSANTNARAPKDADSSDFDSMVHQKRRTDTKAEAAKGTKDAKQERPDGAPGNRETAEEPVASERYAIAAAMMFQAQPDARYTMVSGEDVETLPQEMIEAVQPEQAEAAVIELPETPEAEPENLAGPETEVRSAAVEALREETVPAQQETKVSGLEAQESEEAAQTGQTLNSERAHAEDAPRADRAGDAAQRQARADGPETGNVRTDEEQTAQAAPLFAHVDAPVVKVAEASHPIPLEAENGVEQLGEELGGVLVNSADANRIEVTLTPEHLGKLTIEISRGENGALSIVLHASTERAANLLERGALSLQSMLASNARGDVQVEVRPAEESQQQFLNPDGQNGREQQQQQQHGRRHEQQSAQDFLQQLRLGLVDSEGNAN